MLPPPPQPPRDSVRKQRKEQMPHEVPATLKLYPDDKIEQSWFRENAGPSFS
jgi:hypothetical protein